MAETVNLDALIPREDFLSSTTPDTGSAGQTGKVHATATDLRHGEAFSSTLRKPDFQRETSAWSPVMVRDLVRAFVEGELIPAVICWQSASRLSFVIDGAHRLSAIMAWLFNDYGDGERSQRLNGYDIPDDQIRVARKTRDMIESQIGSYQAFQDENKSPGSIAKVAELARAIAHVNVPLLWVKGTEPKKAERAFFTINQSAVEIDPTELQILNSRTKPNAISARAIVRNAKGHKYWNSFSKEGQVEMEKKGQQIYSALYFPPLPEPIRQEDLPIAGRGYGTQTLPMIFDFVNIANGLSVTDASKSKKKFELIEQAPINEGETLKVISGAERLCRRVTGTHSSSLGLHPAVYFYSATGRHQPTPLLAMSRLIMEMEAESGFRTFTRHRAKFEEFLVSHKNHINQLVGKHGSMAKGYLPMKDYYKHLLAEISAGKTSNQIEEELEQSDRYHWLRKDRPVLSKKPKKISGEAKQHKFMQDILGSAFECNICYARVDKKAMQLGHTVDRKDGGLAQTQNTEWQHPYCNSDKDNLLGITK
jgi:hypothetical protein